MATNITTAGESSACHYTAVAVATSTFLLGDAVSELCGDYNLRRRGKRFLATLFFLSQRRFAEQPGAAIEHHFAWAKRYFGLEGAQSRRPLWVGAGWWPLINLLLWSTASCWGSP